MIVPLLLVVVLSVLAIFFTNSNQTIVQVIVFGHTFKNTVGFVVMGALAVGVLLGVLSMLPAVGKRSLDLLKHKEELAQMKQKDAARKP